MKKLSVVTKDILISEVVKKYPQTASIFLEYGLYCIGCAFAKEETIEKAAKIHQIDLNELISSLNKAIEK